jgi:hypothetical protein
MSPKVFPNQRLGLSELVLWCLAACLVQFAPNLSFDSFEESAADEAIFWTSHNFLQPSSNWAVAKMLLVDPTLLQFLCRVLWIVLCMSWFQDAKKQSLKKCRTKSEFPSAFLCWVNAAPGVLGNVLYAASPCERKPWMRSCEYESRVQFKQRSRVSWAQHGTVLLYSTVVSVDHSKTRRSLTFRHSVTWLHRVSNYRALFHCSSIAVQ